MAMSVSQAVVGTTETSVFTAAVNGTTVFLTCNGGSTLHPVFCAQYRSSALFQFLGDFTENTLSIQINGLQSGDEIRCVSSAGEAGVFTFSTL